MTELLTKTMWWSLLCLGLWLYGLVGFIGQVPKTLSADPTKVDAIVVLTGGSNRLEYGLQLLADGKGKRLFVTGVHDNATVDMLLTRNATPEIRDKLLANAHRTIILGHEAENTIGNAEESQKWLDAQGVYTIRLVTSNYHMPRSLKEFHELMPDLTIIPSPVMPDDFSMDRWWLDPVGRRLVFSEYHKYLASCARHLLLSVLYRFS